MARRRGGTAVRLPAGIRDTKGRALGGRFASADAISKLARRLDDPSRARLLDAIGREGSRAETAARKVSRKFDNDPRRYAKQASTAEDRVFHWQRAYDAVASALAQSEQRAERRREQRAGRRAEPAQVVPAQRGKVRREAKAEREDRKEREDAEREAEAHALAQAHEDTAQEWEFGVEYKSKRNGRRNQASDVDISIRIRSADGRSMGAAEARHALFQFRTSLMETGRATVPHGYQLAAVQWRRPSTSTGWRTGAAQDLDAFSDPLNAWADEPGAWDLRMGGVE
jgi:hypothetical protein